MLFFFLFAQVEAYASKLRWAAGTFSDCLAVVNAFETWQEQKCSQAFKALRDEEEWCRKHFLNLRVMDNNAFQYSRSFLLL